MARFLLRRWLTERRLRNQFGCPKNVSAHHLSNEEHGAVQRDPLEFGRQSQETHREHQHCVEPLDESHFVTSSHQQLIAVDPQCAVVLFFAPLLSARLLWSLPPLGERPAPRLRGPLLLTVLVNGSRDSQH